MIHIFQGHEGEHFAYTWTNDFVKLKMKQN